MVIMQPVTDLRGEEFLVPLQETSRRESSGPEADADP